MRFHGSGVRSAAAPLAWRSTALVFDAHPSPPDRGRGRAGRRGLRPKRSLEAYSHIPSTRAKIERQPSWPPPRGPSRADRDVIHR